MTLDRLSANFINRVYRLKNILHIRKITVLLLGVAVAGGAFFYWKSRSGIPNEVLAIETSCARRENSECLTAVMRLLNTEQSDDLLLSTLSHRYRKALRIWTPAIPKIQFAPKGQLGKGKAGRLTTEHQGNLIVPVLTLDYPESTFELLITLNHELVHLLNSERILPLIGDAKKLKDCLTPYRLELLKDENPAFQAEIEFWKVAPAWFRKRMESDQIESTLLSTKTTYEEYYRILDERMSQDPKFVLRRYIELGEYPSCALLLI